jgi:hypothetical protein
MTTVELTEERWTQLRGPVTRDDGRICIGRVGAPPRLEATSKQYAFWVPDGAVVEETQIVVCESAIGQQAYTYYGVINDVRRQSRKKDIGQEVDESDGDLNYTPPFKPEGVTYAVVTILRTEPPVLTPPREGSDVYLADINAANKAYGVDDTENPLAIGLLKNGDSQVAGPGVLDRDYLLGVNGGHLNVTGTAGRGTKSSFLLTLNRLLLSEARRQEAELPSSQNRLRIVPIILNVKNFDLFYIDRWNRRYDPVRHSAAWQALSVDEPAPFVGAEFYAAQEAGTDLPIATGRAEGVHPYSWSLTDIIGQGLLQYLFAESDANDVNFGALVLDLESYLTDEQVAADGTVTLRLNLRRAVTNFQELLNWLNDQIRSDEQSRTLRNHHLGTWRKLYRRLMKMVMESRGVLRRNDQQGNPLNLVRVTTSDPLVVDLAALAGEPDLQRFVVATIFRQLVEARTGAKAVAGLVYLVTLDELNRFAPRGATDPITRLIETIAAEMRSQGIILLGAQQQASKVSEKVIENAAYRVLGQTGSLELSSTTWRALSESARAKAVGLRPDEKLIINEQLFREPMQVRVPFPVWAMNRSEVATTPPLGGNNLSGRLSDDLDGLIQED